MKVASLPQACHSATAELLPSGEVMLIGGWDIKNKWSKAVKIGFSNSSKLALHLSCAMD